MLIPYQKMYEHGELYIDAYVHIREYKTQMLSTIRCSVECISPVSWMTIMPHKDALDWLFWVNENICLNIDKDGYKTLGVKMRIATGMLNNIKSLTDEEKIQIHSNLTRNIHNEVLFIQQSLLPF